MRSAGQPGAAVPTFAVPDPWLADTDGNNRTNGLGRSFHLSLGVGEESHEAEVHVELLVAVEEG